MKLIDNINELLGDDFKKSIKHGARLKVAASCFSIYAFEALKRELETVESFDFIFTAPTFAADAVTDAAKKERREFHIPKTDRERDLYGTEFEIQLKNKMTQRAIAKECADWMRRKASFRSNRGTAPMQQFAAVQQQTESAVYMPLHGFTAVDLGYQQGDAVSNIVNKFDEPAHTGIFLSLFDQIWSDPSKLEDVTARVCDHIASVYQENSPERIYFLMLFNIFNEFLEDLTEDVLPNDRTGYQDTLVWQKLFNFQRDAATGIINKLETFNGCILADSVGLGKTFTALAVIKYYELRNRSVLVLCPKKLADNWLTYNRNLKTNIFAKDRFNYDVLCHTDLQRTTGESFGMPLNRVNWGNYDLVVIDESHNFRNNDSRRQEVGRGLRLSVNQNGDRMDNPATVHQVNVLTVVASESYKDFVTALQRDISDGLSERPRIADEAYFAGKVLKAAAGDVAVTPQLAKLIYRYLAKNDYTDNNDKISSAYHEAKKTGQLAELPPELAPYAEQVLSLIDSVFSDAQIPLPEDDRKAKTNPLNDNFKKQEFKELWNRINRKAAYTVHFETPELVAKCVKALEKELKVSPLQYTVVIGEQTDDATYDALKQGESFKVTESKTDFHRASAHSAVKYDLIGRLAGETQLTRVTVAVVLQGINKAVFSQYRTNPEDFMQKAARLMNEQKATVIVEHIAYDPTGDAYDMDIFTQDKPKEDFSKAVKANHHIYDYVFTDSKNERDFVKELDASTEVVVYAKLPRGFFIPTPVGNYNPDWAIAFQQGKVKHVYFVAETKGSMSSMDLRKIEESKIECARKFFAKITSDQVKYDVVDGYGKLMDLVM